MRLRILISVLLIPAYAFCQRYCDVCEENNLVNGNGQIIEYGKPLWGYSYNVANTGQYGSITAITEYKNNRRNGRRIQFFNYPYDTASVEHYVNDTLSGSYYYNHTNGKLWTKGVYSNNSYANPPEYWSEDGEKLNENISFNESTHLYYLDGLICNGKIMLYGHGGLDNMHVRDVIWFSKGNIDSVYSYRWAYWGKSSEIHRNYVDSTRSYIPYLVGEKPMWSYSFRIDTINSGLYRDGQDLFFNDRDRVTMDGKCITYYPDGKMIKEEGYYRNGKQVGEWRSYDESGNLIATVVH
jgi:antitoxin component YwqK of YwqJK toxin-antitoxin module